MITIIGIYVNIRSKWSSFYKFVICPSVFKESIYTYLTTLGFFYFRNITIFIGGRLSH